MSGESSDDPLRQEQDTEKKGAALPLWLRARGAANAWFPVSGQELASRMHSLITSPAAMAAAIIAAIGVSTRGLWSMHQRPNPDSGVAAPANLFAPLPKGFLGSQAPSGLTLAMQANRGFLRDEADAPAGAGGLNSSGPMLARTQGVVPEAKNKPPEGERSPIRMESAGYGKLANRVDGPSSRLSGGEGLSRGIGRNFARFHFNRGASGKIEALQDSRGAAFKREKTGVSAGASALTGAVAQRLERMNRALVSTKDSAPEGGSAAQTRQWNNGFAKSGPGVSLDLGRTQDLKPEGSINSAPAAPEISPTPPTFAPTLPHSANATPYQETVDMAQIALFASAGMLLASFLMGAWAKRLAAAGTPPSLALAANVYAYAQWLAYAAMASAAVVAAMGTALLVQGQMTQGVIFTGAGALLAYLAYTAAEGNAQAAHAAQAAREQASAASEAAARQLGSQIL